MRLPGFQAQASLYKTKTSYRGNATAKAGERGPAVRPQWQFCSACGPGCTKICCDPIGGNQFGCAMIPCCIPGSTPCVLDTVFWPYTGSQTFTDACCNTTARGCKFCKFDFKHPEKCKADCVSRCATDPTNQDCVDQCDCCCNSPSEGTVCTDCLGLTWIPNPTGHGGRCIAR
jgi:hypothetical protein